MSKKNDTDKQPVASNDAVTENDTTEEKPANPAASMPDSMSDQVIVVGIGASAGGLEALRSMIPSLPESSNMAYVVAQHLSPQHRSMLVTLLTRNTDLRVSEIVDGDRIEANRIYITPPNSDVFMVENNILHLRKPSSDIGPKPSVDYFFTSLSEVMGERAIGIILSGTGSDGAHGARAIKAAGGIVIAQDTNTAKYDGMPNSAIGTGCVDIIIAPENIGKELVKLSNMPYPRVLVDDEATPPDTLERIFRNLSKFTGSDFSEYKPTTIGRRIERRMNALRIETLEEYVDYLETHPEESDLLHKDILISVTSFFRDQDAFTALSQQIKRITDKKEPGDNIRIWVTGCATGEEAYSIAICLLESVGTNISEYNVQIFGTDLDTDALAIARKGMYQEAAVSNVDQRILNRYFIHHGTNYQVNKRLREMVVFAKQDLIKDPPFSHLDMISCRNLLIYFTTELQKRVLPLFHYSLLENGILFLGKSESVGHFTDLFGTVDKKWKIYRRKHGFRPALSGFTGGVPRPGPTPEPARLPTGKERPVSRKQSMEDAMRNSLLSSYGPASVIIDSNYNILHIYGDVTGLLKLAPGQAELNLTKMARGDISIELRALAHKVNREQTTSSTKLIMPTESEPENATRITVRPLAGFESDNLLLVSFEKVDMSERASLAPSDDDDVDPRISELSQELASTKEHLQTVVEELETANEELQSVNEELQSSNEELQSSNEELETSNEELQSTNEELITVNEELQVKSNELAIAYADIENIQRSVGNPIIVVDERLRITRFTDPAMSLFEISSADIDAIVTSIPMKMDIPDMKQKIVRVISEHEKHEEEIPFGKATYLFRILPYRNEQDDVNGAVLNFIDISERKAAELELEQERNFVVSIMETSPAGIVSVNADGRITFANEQAETLLGISRDKIDGMTYNDPGWKITDIDGNTIPNEELPFSQVMATKRPVHNLKHVVYANDEHRVVLSINGAPILNENNEVASVVFALDDITNRTRMEIELKELNKHLEHRVTEELDKRHKQEQLLIIQSKLAALGEMLGAIAHQWRQPLNSIGLIVQNIMHTYKIGKLTDEFMVEWTDKAMDLIKYMSQTINDFGNFFKPDKERVDFKPSEVVEKAVSFVESTLANNNIEVAIDMDEDVVIHGFPNEYCQAVINILNNARDALVDRKVENPKITIRLFREDGRSHLQIIDNGGGVDTDILPNIFEAYFTSNKIGGTGIGLYMTRLIVENNMDGTVSVDTIENGARFSMII